MENVIIYLCNKRTKPREKTTKKKPKESDPSILNENLQNDLKKLKFNLSKLQNQDEQEEEPKSEVLTPRSKQKSEQLKKKINFLKKAQSSYEFRRK